MNTQARGARARARPPRPTPFDYLRGSAYGTVSISETDGLFAYDDGALRVLDLTDKLVHQITEYGASGGYIASATAFTPDGR
jgi:hypothetical protein